ncbi:MAG: DUF58 domain-containing protein [Planctomycetota bacterium]|nr:DUF58 domain-containing protein [Planctomycetota bacterium]
MAVPNSKSALNISSSSIAPSGSTSAMDRWIDMSALMRIKNLQLRAKSVVDGFHNGLHRSPLHGFSVEFSEYRPYSLGDDPRTIDWKLFARSDRFYIKKFEDETNRRCYLVVDKSKSMDFSSLEYSKCDYARTVAATLAYYLTLQRDAVGLLTFDENISDVLTARFRTGQLKRILSLLEKPSSGASTDLLRPLSHLADIVRQRSLIIILSDFLVPTESLRVPLSMLKARRHDVVLLRVLDPAEVTLNLEKASMLMDIETGREIYVDPNAARASYQKKFQQHQASLMELAGQLGIGWTSLQTNESVEHALFDFLSRQQRSNVGGPRTRSQLAGGGASSGSATSSVAGGQR